MELNLYYYTSYILFTSYSSILNRTACQIWDSAADITEIPIGLPKSVFPNNERMQNMLRNYTM